MSLSPLVLAVPVYNGERFLAETLASLNANGPDVRWWLQDAASKDHTVEVARRFARPTDTITSEPDNGQPDAINRAFAKMGGEIIGFLNADDLILPNTARTVLEYFAAHPNVDLVIGQIEWIDENGRVTGSHTGRIHSLADVLNIYRVWWANRQWVQPEVFFRRSLFEKVGPLETKWNLCFDYEFWVRCFRAGARVAHLPIPFTRFRIHSAQKSTAATQAANEIRAIVRHHLRTGARVSPAFRWVLEAQLDYDEYQLGATGRRPFALEFLRHPQWLFSPPARTRLRAACARLFGGATKPA